MSTTEQLLWIDPETGQALEIAIEADAEFIQHLCAAGFRPVVSPEVSPEVSSDEAAAGPAAAA